MNHLWFGLGGFVPRCNHKNQGARQDNAREGTGNDGALAGTPRFFGGGGCGPGRQVVLGIDQRGLRDHRPDLEVAVRTHIPFSLLGLIKFDLPTAKSARALKHCDKGWTCESDITMIPNITQRKSELSLPPN